MTKEKVGTFSAENQPENRRGRAKYNKLMDALIAKGYSEKQFYERVVDAAMGENGNNMLREVLMRFCPAPKPSATGRAYRAAGPLPGRVCLQASCPVKICQPAATQKR